MHQVQEYPQKFTFTQNQCVWPDLETYFGGTIKFRGFITIKLKSNGWHLYQARDTDTHVTCDT